MGFMKNLSQLGRMVGKKKNKGSQTQWFQNINTTKPKNTMGFFGHSSAGQNFASKLRNISWLPSGRGYGGNRGAGAKKGYKMKGWNFTNKNIT